MIPHLEQQIAFLSACRDHGEDRVEWRFVDPREGFFSCGWKRASVDVPAWKAESKYVFHVRPRNQVIPRAVIPAEDPEGIYMIRFLLSDIGGPYAEHPETRHYRTDQDRSVALKAMLAREEE